MQLELRTVEIIMVEAGHKVKRILCALNLDGLYEEGFWQGFAQVVGVPQN